MKTKKIITKIFIAIALTFMIPQLVLLYMWEDLSTRSTLLLFASTALLIGIGSFLIWDIVQSIRSLFRNIDEITKSELNESILSSGKDEVQIMDNSIELISKKIVENMEELQRSTASFEKIKKDLNDTLLYLESVMNSMGDALIVIDSEYKIRRINPAAKELIKFDEDHLIGRTIDTLFEHLDKDEVFCQEGVTKKRMTCISMDNERIPVDINIQPQIDVIGDRIGHVLVARDMRATLGLLSRLEKATTSLQEPAQDGKGKFDQESLVLKDNNTQAIQEEKMAAIAPLTAGIANEFKTPIKSISSKIALLKRYFFNIASYTQLLKVGLSTLTRADDPELRKFEMDQITEVQSQMKIEALISDSGTIIKGSLDELEQITKTIDSLDVLSQNDEKKEAGIDLNQEIQHTLITFEESLSCKAEIIKQLGFVPPLTCYPQQLDQVFMNLLENASQATGEGDIIRIRTLFKDEQIHVIFQDTGPGISPENLKKIFDPFFTTKPITRGSGLGLYLSYGIVAKHGGTLTVKSVLGEGTIFTIQIPVSKAEVFIHPALTVPAI